MNKKELIPNIVSETGIEAEVVEKVFDAAIEQIVLIDGQISKVIIDQNMFHGKAQPHNSISIPIAGKKLIYPAKIALGPI